MEESLGKEGRQNLGTGKHGGSESKANIQVSDSGMGCVGPPRRRNPSGGAGRGGDMEARLGPEDGGMGVEGHAEEKPGGRRDVQVGAGLV